MLLPVCIIDDFLGPEASGRLLDFAQQQQANYSWSTLISDGARDVVDRDVRASLSFFGDLGDQLVPFRAHLAERLEHIAAETQTRRFDPEPQDLRLVAHGHGHYFRQHVDTATGSNRSLVTGNRVLSLVYYLHTRPRMFTGGALVMYPIVGEERQVIEPRHDRLVAFSSIAPHEVEPIDLPGDSFRDSRFSVVSWLHQKRR